jgi:hypothetical protein
LRITYVQNIPVDLSDKPVMEVHLIVAKITELQFIRKPQRRPFMTLQEGVPFLSGMLDLLDNP